MPEEGQEIKYVLGFGSKDGPYPGLVCIQIRDAETNDFITQLYLTDAEVMTFKSFFGEL